MIAVFVDNAGQHIAGALEYRHPGSRVIFRHRHHLFHHLQIETAEQIGAFPGLIGAEAQRLQSLQKIAVRGAKSSTTSFAAGIDDGATVAFTVTPQEDFRIGSVGGCGGTLAGNLYTTAPVVAEPPNCKTTVASGFSGDLNALFPNAGGNSTGGDGGSGDGGSGDGGGGDGSGSAGVGGGEGKVLGGLVSVTRLTASVSRCR